jgi:hypothetical protein
MNGVSQESVLAFGPVFAGSQNAKNYFTWYVKIRALDQNTKAIRNDSTDYIFIIMSGEIPDLAYDNQACMLR